MISGINPEGQNFINALNLIQAQLSTAQAQIASGLSVNKPSDAPDELSPILQLHAQINQNQFGLQFDGSLEARPSVAGEHRLEAFALQDHTQGVADARIVVDHQDFIHFPACENFSGNLGGYLGTY